MQGYSPHRKFLFEIKEKYGRRDDYYLYASAAADASKATVGYARHNLEGKVIRDHIAAGKTVVCLALTWNDKISFVLNEFLQIKRLTFLDILKEDSGTEAENTDEQFEIEFALMTGEFALMLADLDTALGGEKP